MPQDVGEPLRGQVDADRQVDGEGEPDQRGYDLEHQAEWSRHDDDEHLGRVDHDEGEGQADHEPGGAVLVGGEPFDGALGAHRRASGRECLVEGS